MVIFPESWDDALTGPRKLPRLTFNQRVRSSNLRWITSKAPASAAAGTEALFRVGKAAGAGGALEKRPGRRYKGPLDKGGYRQGKGPRAHSEAHRGAQRATQGALRSFYRIRGYSGGKPPAPRQTARQPVNRYSEERAGPPVPTRPQGGSRDKVAQKHHQTRLIQRSDLT